LFFLYLFTSSGRVHIIDEVQADWQTESLVTRGNTAVPQAVASGLFYGKMDRYGRPQALHGAGQALAAVPWFVLSRVMLRVIPGIPPQARDAAGDAVVVASSAAFAALAVALFYILLCDIGLPSAPALIAALILALATPIFAYSSWFLSEPLTTALLLGAAVALFPPEEVEVISVPRAVLAGALLGYAIWVRPTHVLAIPVFALAAAVVERRRAWRTAAFVALVSGMCGAAYLLRNQYLFGSPLDFGYPASTEGGHRLDTFETPLGTGLYGLLLSPGKSLFLFAPPLLLALQGIPLLARLNRGLAVVAGVTPLVYLLFFARYTHWEGGFCVGPHYLVPIMPLLALGLGPILARGSRGLLSLALVLAVLGLLVQVTGMATNFLEDQATGAYYDSEWNYRMSYAPLISQTQLLFHYLAEAGPAPLGRGFDRWFVFLSKAGVARATVAVVACIQLAAAFYFAWRLKREAEFSFQLGGTAHEPSTLP
jgi:hypothetical protein